MLIEEDQHTSFHNVLMRAAAAEGIGHQHAVCCVTPQSERKFREQFLARLPRNATASKEAANLQSKAPEEKSSELLVAWQYQKYLDSEFDANSNLSTKKKSSSSSASSSTSRSRKAGGLSLEHDFSKSIEKEQVSANAPLVLSLSSPDLTKGDPFAQTDMHATYVDIAANISDFMKKRNCDATDGSASNIGRILLHSVGSPMWRTDTNEKSLIQFLHFLKTFIRSTSSVNAVCCVSVPSFILSSANFLRRIEHMCDYIVHLRSFMGDMESPTGESDYGDFDGLLNVRRLSPGNSFVPAKMEHSEFLFKMKRRKMVIERLSLPPETSRSESNPSADNAKRSGGPKVACRPGGRLDTNLEF